MFTKKFQNVVETHGFWESPPQNILFRSVLLPGSWSEGGNRPRKMYFSKMYSCIFRRYDLIIFEIPRSPFAGTINAKRAGEEKGLFNRETYSVRKIFEKAHRPLTVKTNKFIIYYNLGQILNRIKFHNLVYKYARKTKSKRKIKKSTSAKMEE